MHRVLGLSCDPFGPADDDRFFWESAERRTLREGAEEALRRGHSVWLRGARGSGRRTLGTRVISELAGDGRAVLFADAPWPSTEAELLARLCLVAGAAVSAASISARAEGLYRQVLRAFYQTAPVVVVPAAEPLEEAPTAELQLLADLRLAGHPIAALLAWGEGEPPFDAFQVFELANPSESELRACLEKRLAVCDAADLLSPQDLQAILEGAGGFAEGLERGRLALCHLAFARLSAGDGSLGRARGGQAFDPGEVGEILSLLDSLSSAESPT